MKYAIELEFDEQGLTDQQQLDVIVLLLTSVVMPKMRSLNMRAEDHAVVKGDKQSDDDLSFVAKWGPVTNDQGQVTK